MRRILSFVLVSVLLLGFAGCTPLGKDKIQVTAMLGDSAGLFVGNEVGVLGVPVGKVTSIKPEGTHVRVTMEIDADQPVPADAGAVVVARSVATDRYVELTPVYRSGAKLKDGAVIDRPRTRTPVDFDTVLAALSTFATGIAGSGETANAVGRFIDSGATALKGRGKLFNESITQLAGAVNSVSGQRGNITATMKSLDRLTATMAHNQETIRTFVDQVSAASSLLADERVNFKNALTNLSDAVTLIADFAHRNRAAIASSLDRSTALMQSLMTRRGDLVEILRTFPLAMQNLANTYTPDGRLRVRVDPMVLTPIGGLFNSLCTALPGADLCSQIGPSTLDDLFNGLLGGVKP